MENHPLFGFKEYRLKRDFVYLVFFVVKQVSIGVQFHSQPNTPKTRK